ncbi:MAG: hypothetical protein LBN00_00320 [Oscillospiraceae bacterium]|jgi:hypothetical protein|nr:hypothetical protein [Oscillospiraceae bacterium]
MKIAVFTRDGTELCPFFEANAFSVFARDDGGFRVEREEPFAPVAPAAPYELRERVSALLPLIEDCEILAGGALSGLAFTVFDRAGLHIFEIGELNDTVLFDMISEIISVGETAQMREKIIRDAKPAPTGTDGVYYLDLVLLQTECPEVSSKKAMREFLENTPFTELHLVCRHIPPWIEGDDDYQIDARPKDGDVYAVIRKRSC